MMEFISWCDGEHSLMAIADKLNVPAWDFNWQTHYLLEKPLSIPAGSRVECTAYFDNSAGNPANPDPSQLVRWGDQTWEEMMIGFINYVDAPRRSRRSRR